ncbi:MAG: hypothetical protein ACKV2Q_29775 [Planctomycetaceae bacterium]
MRLIGRNLVTLLLIAVMALPAVSPPALRHRHVDGDKSHQHGVATVERSQTRGPRHSHSSQHSHRVETVMAKESHDDRATPTANSPVEHLHVFWLGFPSALPLSVPDRSDSPRPTASTEQWVPLISEIILPDAAQNGSNILTAVLFTPTELTPRLPAQSEVRPPRESAVAWLCDTARRERSGVLVI